MGDPTGRRRTLAWVVRGARHPAAVLALGYLAGAIPFSNIAARWRRGQDLRDVGTGTVSGTSLYKVAGFPTLALAGSLDVAKGAVAPALAGPDRPVLGGLGAAAGVVGHNWSIFLRGAGGRGISPAMGALLVHNWPGTVVLATGLAVGGITNEAAFMSFVADVALVPVLRKTRGRRGALAGAAVTTALLAKRLTGNQPAPTTGAYLYRLLFDRDTRVEVADDDGSEDASP